MNPETNNARYTAYALNELDAAERARVEQELAAHPELRREVEEIRALSDTLTRALAGEPGVKLDEAGRAAIRTAAQHPAPRARMRFSRSLPWLGAAAALLVTARVADHPLSTFSVDVDTASYRCAQVPQRGPPAAAGCGAGRGADQLLPLRLRAAGGRTPFRRARGSGALPWNPAHHLVRIALKGKEIDRAERPALNLVFWWTCPARWTAQQTAAGEIARCSSLAKQLDERDRVAIVVYAGAAGWCCRPRRRASRPIDRGAGSPERGRQHRRRGGHPTRLQGAREHFNAEGVNRVILCTDGDFNVGLTQRGDLERLIEERRSEACS
jgi:anti-sigma factor RsiW